MPILLACLAGLFWCAMCAAAGFLVGVSVVLEGEPSDSVVAPHIADAIPEPELMEGWI